MANTIWPSGQPSPPSVKRHAQLLRQNGDPVTAEALEYLQNALDTQRKVLSSTSVSSSATVAAVGPETCPLDFGAKGDGATDDTGAITLALAQSSNIYLPSGYSFVTSGHTISSVDKARFFGGGVLKLKAGSNREILRFEDCTRIRIDDIEFDGNKANQSSPSAALYVRNGAYSVFSKLLIHDSKGAGVSIENYGSSTMADEIKLLDCYIQSNASHGIWIFGTSGTAAPGDLIIRGMHIDANDGYGLFVQGTASMPSQNVTIDDCNILSNTLHGLYAAYAIGLRIVGGCQIRNNNANGAVLSHCTHGTVSDARVHLNSRGAGSYSGIDIDTCSDLLIEGCYTGDNGGSVRQDYGIQIYGPSYNIYLDGNNFGPTENELGATNIVVGSTYTSYNNKGLGDTFSVLPGNPSGVVCSERSGSRTLRISDQLTLWGLRYVVTLPATPDPGTWARFELSHDNGATWEYISDQQITATPQTFDDTTSPDFQRYVPQNNETCKGRVRTYTWNTSNPTPYVSAGFSVNGLGDPAANVCSAASLGPELHKKNSDGIDFWGCDKTWTISGSDPNLWTTRWTVQTVNGSGTPDPANPDEKPGNEFNKPGETVTDKTNVDWLTPAASYGYRTARFRLYARSRKVQASPWVLQATCWGGASYADITPTEQTGGIDMSRAASTTVLDGLTLTSLGIKRANSDTDNQAQNGNFDDGLNHWTAVNGSVWSVGPMSPPNCIKITSTGSYLLQGPYKCNPGDRITVTLWACSDGLGTDHCRPFISFRDSAGNIISQTLQSTGLPPSTPPWGTISNSGVAPANAVQYYVYAPYIANGNGLGTWYVDNVLVRRYLPTGDGIDIGANGEYKQKVGSEFTFDGSGNLLVNGISLAKATDGTLAASKFASSISPVSVASSLPTLPDPTNYPPGRLLYNTTSGTLYRVSPTGSAWQAAVGSGDIVANSITGGLVAAGAIAAGQLYAGEILIGQGGGKPTRFAVKDTLGVTRAFLGADASGFFNWFYDIRIGPDINNPVIYGSAAGVAIAGASFSLNLNNVTTSITNFATDGSTYCGLSVLRNGTTAETRITPYSVNLYRASGLGIGAYMSTDGGAGSLGIQGSTGLSFSVITGGVGYGVFLGDSMAIHIGSYQVVGARQTDPGAPSFANISDAQTWCASLRTALRNHGLI